MTVKLNFQGIEFEAGNAEEAADLFHYLLERSGVRENGTLPSQSIKKKRGRPPKRRVSTVNLSDFAKGLPKPAMATLRALASDRGKKLTTGELSSKAKVEASHLKYIVRQIRSAAKKHGLSEDKAISTERFYEGRQAKSYYSTGLTAEDLT